eukprot:CAMPEP_0177794914 /NCGR_PEP_ID=MMETSP0491_2-20121128/25921_1 /TAXON_ID=63592 /ORGANISM="Tetraselmis chuii, Strain PLY429" /LENGTH=150 /DNA_ID=CAMNT_0019317645 /DNA_START=226 /DNA_END=679 /DNA_ORIENTATION=-
MDLEGRYTGLLGETDRSMDTSLIAAAARVAKELADITVDPLKLQERARFLFDGCFLEHEFYYTLHDMNVQGVETDLMTPAWFEIDRIPFEEMPADDKIWYPPFFEGKLMRGSFEFQEDNPLVIKSAKELKFQVFKERGAYIYGSQLVDRP